MGLSASSNAARYKVARACISIGSATTEKKKERKKENEKKRRNQDMQIFYVGSSIYLPILIQDTSVLFNLYYNCSGSSFFLNDKIIVP